MKIERQNKVYDLLFSNGSLRYFLKFGIQPSREEAIVFELMELNKYKK